MTDFVHGLRANQPVASGPAQLTSWCVVAISPVGNLVKPAGTIAYNYNGAIAWLNVDGTAAGWVQLGAISAARTVLDVDYSAVSSVALPTIDPTCTYQFIVRNDDASGTPTVLGAVLSPSTGNGNGHYIRTGTSLISTCGLQIALGDGTRGPSGTGELGPVVEGRHDFRAWGRTYWTAGVQQLACWGGLEGVTDYSGWTVQFINAGGPYAVSGHLKVIEMRGPLP